MLKRIENLIFERAETDLAAARRVFAKKMPRVINKARFRALLSMVQPGDVVFDCGANIGAVSADFAARGGIVHAFEPDPDTFAKLAARFADEPLVKPRQVAVGVEAGLVDFHRTADFATNEKRASQASSIFDPSGGEGETFKVEVVDLLALIDEAVAEHGELTVLKLDIEGAELELLEAMAERGMFDRIRVTLAETHPRIRKGEGHRFDALRELASKNPGWNLDLDWH